MFQNWPTVFIFTVTIMMMRIEIRILITPTLISVTCFGEIYWSRICGRRYFRWYVLTGHRPRFSLEIVFMFSFSLFYMFFSLDSNNSSDECQYSTLSMKAFLLSCTPPHFYNLPLLIPVILLSSFPLFQLYDKSSSLECISENTTVLWQNTKRPAILARTSREIDFPVLSFFFLRFLSLPPLSHFSLL